MKISIITVCFNSEKTIKGTIESLVSQDSKNIEYIIIDGSSTDGTKKIIEKYKKYIDIMISEKDEGIYDAMNKGVRNATGDYIYFLNADDRFYNNKVIINVERELVIHDNPDYLYGGVICRNIFGGQSENVFLREISGISFKKGQNIKHQSLFVKRELFNELGFFNTEYKVNADYEWECRLLVNKCRGQFMNLIVAYYNQTGYSSRGVWTQYKEKYKIILKYFGFYYSSLFLLDSIIRYSFTKILRKLRIAHLVSKFLNRVRGTDLKNR